MLRGMKEINLKEISIKAINYLTALPKEEREPMALGFTLALAFYLLHPGAPLPGEGGFSRHKDLLSPAPLEELRKRAWEAAWEAFMATGHEELLILPSLFYGEEGPPLLPPEEAQALFVDGFVLGTLQVRRASRG